MTTDLTTLTKDQKKVAAKVLYGLGYGSIKLEKMLGISDNTVLRSLDEATPEQLKKFEEEFRQAVDDAKRQGIALGVKRLIELIPKERRIDQVVRAVEFLEGKTAGNDNPNLKKRIVAEEFFS